MSDFKVKVTAELDTSNIQSGLDKIKDVKIDVSVDTSNLRSQIESALKNSFKINVSPNISGQKNASKITNSASAVGLTAAQLRQVEAVRRKSQIRVSEFEKKSNQRLQEAKLKNIDKVETAQKTSDIKVSEAQRKQDIKDASWREKQRETESRRIQRQQEAEMRKAQKQQEKIAKLTNPNFAHERAYGATYRNAYDHALANGRSVKSAEKLGLSAVNAEKIYEFGSALNEVTASATRYVALPVAAATVASVKAFMDYETAFTGVRKTVNGSEAELQALSDGLEEMALRVPVASVELANIAKTGGQLGIPTKSLLKFVETFAALETSTNLKGEEGASTLARFMNVVNEDFGNIENVGSTIVDLGNNYATTESEIANMAQRLGSTGAIIGMSTSDILGYSAALSSLGIRAEMGGSAMTRIWQEISQTVSEGGKGLKEYSRVSKMSAKEFAKAWKEDPTKAFNSLLKGLNESSDIIKELDNLGINNVRDIQSMQKLAERYDLVTDALGRADTAYKENTALTTEANRAYNTTASKLQIAKESIVQAGRSVGESLAPAVIDLAGGVQKAAKSFADLDDDTKSTIVNGALMTAGIIAGTNATAKFVQGVGTLKGAFVKLKTVSAPLIKNTIPAIGKALTKVHPAVAAVAITAAAIGVGVHAAKKHNYNNYNKQFKWADGLTEQATKTTKASNEFAEISKLQEEVSEIKLVISSDDSSVEDLTAAKNRLQEISAYLKESYGLEIDADTTKLDEALSKLKEIKYLESKGSRSTLNNDLSSTKSSYEESKKNVDTLKKNYETAAERSKNYNLAFSQIEELEAQLPNSNLVKDYATWVDGANKILDLYKIPVMEVHRIPKSENENKFDTISIGDEDRRAYSIELLKSYQRKYNKDVDTKGKDNAYSRYQDTLTAINKFEKSRNEFIDSALMELEFGNQEEGVKDLTTAVKDYGASAEETAIKATKASLGIKSFSENAGDSEGIQQAVTNYQKYATQFGATSEQFSVGSALVANGFDSISAVAGSGEQSVSTFLKDMKFFGEQNGLFEGLDSDGIGRKLTEIAQSIDLLPDTKHIEIDAEGNISIIDDVKKKVDELNSQKNIKLSVDAEGNIKVLETADKKLKNLADSGMVNIKLNVDTGNLDIIDLTGNKLGEITAEGTVIWKSDETNVAPPQGFTAPGTVNYDVGTSPDTVPPADSTANYNLGNVPTTAPEINGDANYKGSFPTKAPTLFGTIIYRIKKLFGGGDGEGENKVDGTAHASGTAFANGKRGNWGTRSSGVALGGELGEELVVRDGKFFTIGSDSAEFFSYRKDDIIFNAEQTKQIFEKGKITHGKRRGRAFANGTVHEPNKDTVEYWQDMANTILRSNPGGNDFSGIEDTSKKAEHAFGTALEQAKSNFLMTHEAMRDMHNMTHAELALENMSKADLSEANDIVDIYRAWYDDIWNTIDTEQAKIKEESDKRVAEAVKAANPGGESFYDWSEVLLSRTSDEIESYKDNTQNKYLSYQERMSAADYQRWYIGESKKFSEEAYARYMQQADSIGLDEYHASRVRNGTIDIESVSDENLKKRLSDYQQWYEKARNVSKALEEINALSAQVYEDEFENITNKYDSIIAESEFKSDLISESLDKAEAEGLMASDRYYRALSEQEQNNIVQLEKERAELTEILNKAVDSGEIIEYSEAWFDLRQKINDVTQAISNSSLAVLEFSQEMENVRWDRFNFAQDAISELTKETDFLISLLGEDLYEKTGDLNEKGLAAMGLHGLNYNTHMEKSLAYANELKEIEKKIASDSDNTLLIQRKREILELQRESILAAEEEKNAIVDMVEEGINVELEALQELIDKYNDSLDSAQDLYEYQQKVAEQSSDIASIEKQLSAYENDTSEETKAIVQKLKVELEDAKKNLEDTEYNRYTSVQKDLLDELYTNYETLLNGRLDDVDSLIEESIENINSNSDKISTTLENESDNVGYTLSSSMKSIWENANNSIQGYFGTGSTFHSFILAADGYFKNTWTNSPTGLQLSLSNILQGVNSLVKSAATEATRALELENYRKQMKENSINWYAADSAEQSDLASKNNSMGEALGLTKNDGKWYDTDGSEFYTISEDEKIRAIIEKMKKNSARWSTDLSIVDRKKLEDANAKLAAEIQEITGKNVHRENGVWWINDKELYSYKTGGLADFTGAAWLDGSPSKPELVLNAEDTKNFISLKDTLREMTKNGISLSSGGFAVNEGLIHQYGLADVSDVISRMQSHSGNNQSIGEINISIPIEHVDNYNDFITQLQKDNQFEKMIRSMSVDLLDGKSTLSKNKFKW